MNIEDPCECGEDTEIATHAFFNGEAVDKYFCKKCYNQKDEK
jgi:hypothetical protein